MAEEDKKTFSATGHQDEYEEKASIPEFYDPSKESIWTRLGLTAESFKRAPGTTGYAHTRIYLSSPAGSSSPSSDAINAAAARSSQAAMRA